MGAMVNLTCPSCTSALSESAAYCPVCGVPVAGRVGSGGVLGSAARAGGSRSVAKIVLRWLAMIPAAFLASGLAGLIAGVVTPMVAAGVGLSGPGLNELVRAGVMGGFFVYVGTHVSPSEHPAVPLSLASLYSVALIAAVWLVSSSSTLVFEGSPSLMYATFGVAIAVAFITAVKIGFFSD